MRDDSSVILEVIICNIPLDKKYESRVYCNMTLNDKKQKFPIIITLSAPVKGEARLYYDLVYLFGPALESELV